MTNKKMDELIADLGYALMYLKQARMETKGADFQINRTRELVEKVGDALIKERGLARPGRRGALGAIHAMPMDQKPDARRVQVVKLAQSTDMMKKYANRTQALMKLYDIVVDEHENWDGEEVSAENIVKLMQDRFADVGLAPSRNS